MQCDTPEELPQAIEEALTDAPPLPALRANGARWAYDYTPGGASNRAADAIESLMRGPMPEIPRVPSEVMPRTEELLGRLRTLGATEAIIERTGVAKLRPGDSEFDRLRALNDHLLRGEILDALRDEVAE